MVLAGFVVGQALSERPFSLVLALVSMGVWAGLMMGAVLFAAQREES